MNIKLIETFYWVCELKSFTLAAQKLFTSQPAISARIKQLEEHIGKQLIIRESTIVLTPAGRQCFHYCHKVISLLEEMQSVIGDSALSLMKLRLGLTDLVACTWMQEWLELIHNKFHHVEISLTIDVSARLTEKLLKHELEAVIVLDKIVETGIQCDKLSETDLVWVASTSCLFEGNQITKESLKGKSIYTLANNTHTYQQFKEWLADVELVGLNTIESHSLLAIREAVLNGHGVGLIPSYINHVLFRGDNHKIIPSHPVMPKLAISLCYPQTLLQAMMPISHLAALACKRYEGKFKEFESAAG